MSSLIRRLDTSTEDFESNFAHWLQSERGEEERIRAQTAAILADVRQRGDRAVLDATERFDALRAERLADLEIPAEQLCAAYDALATEQKTALQTAAQRIRTFHEKQLQQMQGDWEMQDEFGNRLGQTLRPLQRVGIYIPGGKAAYPSSMLMNALPAAVAGVEEIIAVAPAPKGETNALVLAAAHLAGVNRFFKIGGAQAIAALAFGTETIAAADKITGPGNAYVAEAKRQVFGHCGIDMVAGPSEIVILCDGDVAANPLDWLVMDLFSQAEHDEKARAFLLCPNRETLDAAEAAIARLLPQMPRREIIARALQNHGALIQVRDMNQACELCDRLAPEHVEICAKDARGWAAQLRHAGAIFLGSLSSEALGDYCAGPNHVLPTARAARYASPLGVYDFLKRTSLIEITPRGASALGAVAAALADGEGLSAHAQAARYRIKVRN